MDGPLNILLADDDEADRFLFTEALAQLRIKTALHTVNDGTQLMRYLHKMRTALPHLLFLDLNMPRKKGIECLKEIRSNPQLRGICTAIYSTSASENDIEATFRAGANVFIQKPNDFEMLKKVVEKVVIDAKMYQDPPFNKDFFLLRL